MSTIYEMMRPGTRGQWKRKKKQLRRMGLRSGEWYTMSMIQLCEDTIRAGMVIQNIAGRPALYRVVKHMSKLVLVNLNNGAVKDLDDPRKYRWVRA